MAQAGHSQRWYGLDIVRLIAFFAAALFHFHLFCYDTPTVKFVDQSLFMLWIDHVGHALSFSGFTIALLSSFLLALTMQRADQKLKLFLVLLFGWAYISYSYDSPYLIAWDIFGLFFTSMCVLMAVRLLWPNGLRLLGICGYIMLWIPFWKLADVLPPGLLTLKSILGLTSCASDELAEWPMLPWSGLIFMGYWLGSECRTILHTHGPARLRIGRTEGVIWAVALAASIPQWGGYYVLPFGHQFACVAYRQEPYVFWSHIICPIFLMRLSFDPRIQARLAANRLARAISNLAISRKFWLAYALQYIYSYALGWAVTSFAESYPSVFNRYEMIMLELFCFSILIQNELMTRYAWWLITKISQLLGRFHFRQPVVKEIPSKGMTSDRA